MKNLFSFISFLFFGLALSLLIVFNARAENWMPISKIKDGTGKTVYMDKADCEKLGECVDVTGKDIATTDVVKVEVDDESKPKFEAKSQVEACSDQKDCYQKLADKKCDDLALISEDYSEVYCTKQVGFEQKEVEVLQENPSKVAAKLAEIEKGAQVSNYQAIGSKKRRVGSLIIDLSVGFLDDKGLATAQSQKLITDLKPITDALSFGMMVTARTLVEAKPADEFFTKEFKDLLLWEMAKNGY